MGKKKLFVQYCAQDFIDGTILMDPAEELAYRRICDLIYLTNGPVPDEPKKMAPFCKVSLQKWRKIRDYLIAEGKLFITDDGKLFNERCEETLQKVGALVEQKRQASNERWRRERERNALKNNEPCDADACANAYPDASANGDANRKPKTVEKNIYSDEFESFWRACPKEMRKGKLQAFRYWKRQKVPRETLLSALEAYKRCLSQDGWRNSMYCPKFLNPANDLWREYLDDAEAQQNLSDDQNWAEEIEEFRRIQLWNRDANGPAPGEADCRAPPELLERAGFEIRAIA